MIPRPSQAEVLAEIRAHKPYCGKKKEKWLLNFLEDCEYIGNGQYVVTTLKQGFGRRDKQSYPLILAAPYDPSPLPN
jgi:hypothetical protein